MSDRYRIHAAALKSAALTAQTTMVTIPCDRNAVIEECVIASRAGVTGHSANYSTVTVLNGANELFKRDFDTGAGGDGGISALTKESLTQLKDTTVDKNTCLQIRYNYAGTGLAVDLDFVLVFRLSR